MSKSIGVFGIFKTRDQIEIVIEELRLAGYRAEDISVLLLPDVGKDMIAEKSATKVPESAAAGGGALGAIAGGMLGWLAGIGALAIPGIGPVVAAGPLMAALAGMSAGAVLGGKAGAAVLGGTVSALVALGLPESAAKSYEGLVSQGRILLSVHSDTSRAQKIFEDQGAESVASTGARCAETAERVGPEEDGPKGNILQA